MRRRMKNNLKLNKGFRMRLRSAKLIVWTMAIALVVFMLPVFSMNTVALGGTVTGSATEGDTFWRNIPSPKDLVISQEVKVKDTNLSLDKTYTATANTTTIQIPFSRDGEFKPSISVNTLNSHSERGASNKWKDSVDTEWYFDYVYCYSKGAITYYRVDASGADMGEQLLNYYKYNFTPSSGSRKSSDMMATTEERVGRAFIQIAEDCARVNGWKRYTGTGIPLWEDGETVQKIEMITVNPIDYYNGVYRENGAYYGSYDFDLMVYSSHTYNFSYTSPPQELAVPAVSTESGYSLANGIPEEDVIILTNSQASGIARSQYYLSATRIANTENISWNDYTEPFSAKGMNYLYIRSDYVDGSQKYVESDVVGEDIRYLSSSTALVGSTPINGESLDVGESVSLSYTGASSGASLVYTIDTDKAPTLTKVSYTDRHQNLQLDSRSGGNNYLEYDGQVYVKNSGIWYKSSDPSLKIYADPIVAGEQLQIRNTMVIYALVIDEGKELGEFQTLRFTYGTEQQTAVPETTVATTAAEPTIVQMGDLIGLVCNTPGSKIFYTTNGSAPIILATPEGPVAGENTKEYNDAEPIVVNETIADYKQSFLIMAQAVTYTKIDDSYYRTRLDSTIAKFVYNVGALTPVKGVQSVPQTNADTPLEIQVGDRIQLYSETEGVSIFYTLDGSEPLFDVETEEPGENTYKYSGATGIIVEKATDSSLFTITAVAYKEGLATSNISRMVYAYPAAVSSPYANPSSATVAENTEVILQTATKGAVIYYEIAYGDNVPKQPSTASKVFDATVPIVIRQKTTVKAYAVKDGMESVVVTFTYDVSSKLNAPKPSVETGAVVASGTNITLSADDGATIHYTLDGSDPKDSANKKVLVGNNVILSGDVGSIIILRAYATKNGYSDSEVGNYSYSISTYTGGIYTNHESGSTVKNGEIINLYTDMSDADIYYTTDGSAPTEDSIKGNSVVVDGQPGTQMTIMAMALMEGSKKTTSFATFTYTIMNKLSAPTASVPNKAVFTQEGVVKLNAETGNIYYTTDGSEPTTASNLYKKSIVIDKDITIKAIAVNDNYQQSDVSTFVYGFANQVAPPIANYTSGELEMGTTVTFSTETQGATIYYRTDGVEPNLDIKDGLEIYTGPITVTKAMNFKVIAIKEHMRDSRVLSVGYTVREPIILEQAEVLEEQIIESNNGRLQSRRSFSDTESGPSYTDVVLRNATYGVVVSGEEEAIQNETVLKVENIQVTEATERMVKTVLKDTYGIISSYNVKLLVADEEIQPSEQIEIGIPIPVEYQNSIIQIVRIQEDGYLKICNTRRTGGVAYAIVNETGDYSIVAPTEYQLGEDGIPWVPIGYGGAIALAGIGSSLLYLAKKRKEEGEELYV